MPQPKEWLKKLIQHSTVLIKTDQKILLDRIDSFSDKKIKKLIDLFEKEQHQIQDFSNELETVKVQYQHALENDKKLLREKIESNESEAAERDLANKLTDL